MKEGEPFIFLLWFVYSNFVALPFTWSAPLDGTHLAAVRGLIARRCPPKCINGKRSLERRYFVQ